MNTQLNIPSPSSVQSTPPIGQSYRLLTADGKLFTRISWDEVEAQFSAAISAYIAAGNTRVLMHDIPEPLQATLLSALRASGWFVKTEWFADLDAVSIAAIPYTSVAYSSVQHLCWSKEPFPLHWEEKLWLWIKSWFA